MKSKGVKLVQFYGASSMAVRSPRRPRRPTSTRSCCSTPGSTTRPTPQAGPPRRTVIDIDFTPLEDIASNPEMQLPYDRWLQQVSPGAKMTYFGLFAWSATRLAVQRMVQLGGRLSRPALVASIRAVHAWTGNGLHAAMDVGGKRPAACWRFVPAARRGLARLRQRLHLRPDHPVHAERPGPGGSRRRYRARGGLARLGRVPHVDTDLKEPSSHERHLVTQDAVMKRIVARTGGIDFTKLDRIPTGRLAVEPRRPEPDRTADRRREQDPVQKLTSFMGLEAWLITGYGRGSRGARQRPPLHRHPPLHGQER